MHNRLYYNDGRQNWEADIEPYETRPYSLKEQKVNFPYHNYYNSDYQLIYGERFIGFFPDRLKSVNELLMSNDFLNIDEIPECFSKLSNVQKLQQREPWNNTF
jgi:hypothetical protein